MPIRTLKRWRVTIPLYDIYALGMEAIVYPTKIPTPLAITEITLAFCWYGSEREAREFLRRKFLVKRLPAGLRIEMVRDLGVE